MSDATWELPGVTHWDGCGDVGAPEHAHCKKRADLPTTLDPGDYAAGFGDGYGRGMTDSARQVLAYRHILQDLIAELQDASTGYDPDCQNGCGDVPGAGCPTHYEQAVERAADRAEQRLREVRDE